ncbi:MAG: aromatic ring-hydroxylating dioxygenase subunit alpha [Gemmataceae bacterium]|nr:aromatic ring-hydroxylating dioxygenase subunit alpha [Gemmataceae bacterium]MDW8263809.1 aromatic ring-hydroxylating dioxygenase subunit alpha [Gemmataceae bacterium]
MASQAPQRFDASLPLERAWGLPSCCYLDPAWAEAERRHIFGQTWQAVARVDQLASPGDFVTVDLAGEPIVLWRDHEGSLRAFYNVCRHRAAVLLSEETGKLAHVRCPYHGWTYDLAGNLRGTPEFDGVADFRRDDFGLVPVAVDVWGPIVWVHLGLPVPLHAYLAPLPEQSARLGLETLRFVERRTYHLACNWKVFVDNYLDGGYHIPPVHPELADCLDYRHYQTTVAGFTSLQCGPLTSGQGLRPGDRAYYWWVFPNFMINAYRGVMDTNWVVPLDAGRCRVVIDFYFAETEGEAARSFMAESIALAERIQQEDIAICEAVQRGLASRSYTAGRFSVRREAAVYHFHRLVHERLTVQQAAEGPTSAG